MTSIHMHPAKVDEPVIPCHREDGLINGVRNTLTDFRTSICRRTSNWLKTTPMESFGNSIRTGQVAWLEVASPNLSCPMTSAILLLLSLKPQY